MRRRRRGGRWGGSRRPVVFGGGVGVGLVGEVDLVEREGKE